MGTIARKLHQAMMELYKTQKIIAWALSAHPDQIPVFIAALSGYCSHRGSASGPFDALWIMTCLLLNPTMCCVLMGIT